MTRLFAIALALVLALALLVAPTPAPADALVASGLDQSFDRDGIVTTDFGGSDYAVAYGVVVQPDGKTVVVGGSGTTSPDVDFAVARYNVDGSPDTGFSVDGRLKTDFGAGTLDVGVDVAIDASGRIVVVGISDEDFAVARYNADGTLDTSFSGDGLVTTDIGVGTYDVAYGIAIQTNGKIVAVGFSEEISGDTNFALARYNSDGSLDLGFNGGFPIITSVAGNDSIGLDVALQGDGKIVVAGQANENVAVARYNLDGSPDLLFSGDGQVTTDLDLGSDDDAFAVGIQADGKVVAAGSSFSYDTFESQFALVRYGTDGVIDTSFSSDGIVLAGTDGGYDRGRDMVIQPNGKVLVAGTSYFENNDIDKYDDDFSLARFNSDGSLDTTFNADGFVITAISPDTEDGALGLALQPDGKLVTAGVSNGNFAVARYTGTDPLASLGYWLVAKDGGIFSFGDAPFYGSTGNITLNKPIVGMAATPSGNGYWFVASDGGIFAYGDAPFFGSTGNITLNKPIVGMAVTPSGNGYWLVATDGGIFAFGDAPFYGSTGAIVLNKPIVSMTPTISGNGYWFVAADGGIFSFGDANFYGSSAGLSATDDYVGMAATPSGGGYWLQRANGYADFYGDAFISAGFLATSIVGIAATLTGNGYWRVGADGLVISVGDAGNFGSMAGVALALPVVGMAARPRPS